MREGMHICCSHGSNRNTTVVHHVPLHIIFLSQGFPQKLSIPPAERPELVPIGHNKFRGNAIFLCGNVFQSSQQKSRIFVYFFRTASFLYHLCTFQETFYIYPGQAGKHQAYLRKNTEPATDSIGDSETREMSFFC